MNKKLLSTLALILAVILLVVVWNNNQKIKDSGSEKPTETASQTKEPTSDNSKTTDATSGASMGIAVAPSEIKDQYDVIIVGAGGAGMAAALEAHAQGASPVIFEKMPIAGGNTLRSSSGMNASETKFQKEQGIDDSNDLFYEETLAGGRNTNDTELLRFFVDHSSQAIDWLDSMGIRLNNITILGGMSKRRTHRPEDGSAVGKYLVDGLLRNLEEQKIPLFVNANVTEITKENGVVTGVMVSIEQGEARQIKAKAVVVATGGYGANQEMISKEAPQLTGLVTTNQAGSTGDGITMIKALGGATVDMDKVQIHPTVEQSKSYLIGEAVRGEGAILVNLEGHRFVNELTTRDKVSAAINENTEKAAWLIFDAGVKERVKAVSQYQKMDLVKEAPSIEELAQKTNLPADVLKASVGQWNQSVAAKADAQFERTTGMDNDISKAPFYAIKIGPGIHHTMGGVKINANTEVLNDTGTPIARLYAAGEVTGGLHGSNRIGGNAVADIIIFGRQAGNKSAEYAKTK